MSSFDRPEISTLADFLGLAGVASASFRFSQPVLRDFLGVASACGFLLSTATLEKNFARFPIASKVGWSSSGDCSASLRIDEPTILRRDEADPVLLSEASKRLTHDLAVSLVSWNKSTNSLISTLFIFCPLFDFPAEVSALR